MQRRAFIATAGAGLLAGCSGVIGGTETDADEKEEDASPAAGGTGTVTDGTRTVADFESGSLSSFGRASEGWAVAEGSAFEGDRFLSIDATGYHDIVSMPGDGLPYYPKPGDVIEGYVSLTVADHVHVWFGVDQLDDEVGGTAVVGGYGLDLSPYEGHLALVRQRPNAESVTVDADDARFERGTVHRVTVEWGSDGRLTGRLATADGETVAEVAGSDGSLGQGGFGFRAGNYEAKVRARFDHFRATVGAANE